MTFVIDDEEPDTDEELAEAIIQAVKRLNQSIDDARGAGLTVDLDDFDELLVDISRRKRIARTRSRFDNNP